MATQKNLKSKVTASKSKASKAVVKKTPSKATAKAKPAAKSKTVTKAQTPKAKKTTSAKAKPVQKQATKKQAPATAKKASGSAKPKTVQGKGSHTASKGNAKSKAAPIAKASKPSANGRPKLNTPAKKTAPVTAKAPAKKPATLAKPTAPVKTEAKAKPVEVKKPQASPMPVKSTSGTQTKAAFKSSGSKASDIATKPSVSPKVTVDKPKEELKSKESHFKPSKPITVNPAKPFEKMSEKKEIKPMAATASAEEPQKTRYNDKELEEFDQLIDQKLIVAREQLEFYLKQLEDMAENPDNKIKGLDDGLSSLESERISSMASRQQKLIQHLENAKIRIKNKVYGICRETGKLISKERLRAVPHATLSIEAKQAQN